MGGPVDEGYVCSHQRVVFFRVFRKPDSFPLFQICHHPRARGVLFPTARPTSSLFYIQIPSFSIEKPSVGTDKFFFIPRSLLIAPVGSFTVSPEGSPV